jgi:hypothetical protein
MEAIHRMETQALDSVGSAVYDLPTFILITNPDIHFEKLVSIAVARAVL